MNLTSRELEELLRLALSALRGQAGQGASAAPALPTAEPAPVPGRTLNDWLDLHEKQLRERGYKAPTIKNRAANLAHVRRLWGQRPINQIRPHEIASALKTFSAERSSTAVRVMFELRDALNEAVANGWADTNPAAHVKPPKHKIARARLKAETWHAMRVLAHAGPQRWIEPMLLLALVTGQRRADLAKMGEGDIVTGDDGREYLRIEQQKQAGKGYGARVEIPLDLVMDAIGMSVREVIEVCRKSAKPGATFLRKANGTPIEQSSLSARFHEHIVAVLGEGAHKIYQWPSLHEVRSLSARLYRVQGLDVQTLLGHKRAEMTALYEDDRGLSATQWKRVALPTSKATSSAA